MKKLNICLIADSHTQHRHINVPKCDVLIFAGDGEFRTAEEVIRFNMWLETLPVKHIYVTGGNHDFFAERQPEMMKRLITNGTYLESESATLPNGMKLYMSPMSVTFMDWCYMDSEENLAKYHWNRIPDDVDILVTHTPPFGYLDFVDKYGSLGSKSLAEKIKELPQLKYHAFGHIHRDEGHRRILETETTTFINCGVLDNRYNMIWEPIVIKV